MISEHVSINSSVVLTSVVLAVGWLHRDSFH